MPDPDSGERLAELIFVGDVMLGRGVSGNGRVFSQVDRWLSGADLAAGNYEGVVAESGFPLIQPLDITQDPYRLDAPPAAAAHLQVAGFDVLSLANNHALDRGPDGLADTLGRLRSSGIAVIGARPMPGAYQPVIRRVKGLRIAFLAFNTVVGPANSAAEPGADLDWAPAIWDQEAGTLAIRQARLRSDLVVVMMHWGEEYALQPTPWQRRTAQEIAAAGADLVLGQHPHVVQGTQVLANGQAPARRSFVAYSLGNFVFDQFEDPTRQGLALRVFVDTEGIRAVQALPVWAGPNPRLAPPADAPALIERIRPPGQQLAFLCDQQGCQSTDAPWLSDTGIFWSGAIDLTGDGVPENIRRQSNRVLVFHGDTLAWESPSEWQVIDLALGDPNDDGRYEMLLAVEKIEANGQSGSHPFVIGYRSGLYRQLWGGSAVADPIREVALGDVDGDGVEELVVIEEYANRKNAVAVWRWHGWGFSLAWRSEEGYYQGLILVQDGKQMKVRIEKTW